MDRFIVQRDQQKHCKHPNLKSNMDRFIGVQHDGLIMLEMSFKIQYGQIYSAPRDCLVLIDEIFKIQYGQIYR